MRIHLPKAFLLILVALTLWGCASFDGTIMPLHQAPNIAIKEATLVQSAPIEVYFEKPEVIDTDEERDFSPLAETFAASLRQVSAAYLCRRKVFARCKILHSEGDYRLKTRVVVDDYRQAHGGTNWAIFGGLFLPPLLGYAWSVPVCGGTCSFSVAWVLEDPSGREIWKGQEVVGDHLMACISSENVAIRLKRAIEKSLTSLSQAALAAEEEAARGRALLAKKTEETKLPTAAREVVAVFDVQDVSNRFEEDLLLQLTSYLSTTMVASGRFTVVPREQLRARLADKKSQSYKACYDDACQIELGKAVAAQKSLATQLLQVGQKCIVVANLIDLKTETTISGAKVQTDCDVDKLLGALDEV
ncbi:MAG: hypothetical protein JRF33_26145, partial [Deltaproteobacteria bacterium]|nr:hypothetical protein [Deltaproteobacteria bacterium]